MLQTTSESQIGGAASVCFGAGSATSATLAIDIVDIPVPGRGGGRILHRSLDHRRHTGSESFAQCRAEFVRRLDLDSARAASARHRRVVHAVGIALACKKTAEAGAVVRVLQTGNRA